MNDSSFTAQAVLALATLAGAVLLGLVLAYWTWEWFGPEAEPPAPESESAVTSDASRVPPLFGAGAKDAAAPAATGLAVTLLGVVAARDAGEGYAVVRMGGRDTRVVRAGDELGPGVRISEVHPDHVIVERGPARERLAWPVEPLQPVPAARGAR